MLRSITRSSRHGLRQTSWRALATEADQTVSPSAPPLASELEELVPDDEYIPPPQTLTEEDTKKLNTAPKNYLWARTLDYINTPADALVIIDALEHRYGRIREFRFLRDYEIPTKYQNLIRAEFRDPVSAERIPDDGEVVRVAAPPPVQRDGGISYTELQEALSESNFGVAVPANESVSPINEKDKNIPRSFSIRVERSSAPWQYAGLENREKVSRDRWLAFGHAYLDWNGFSDIQPLESSPYIHNNSVEGQKATPISIDRQELRTILSRWAGITKRSDPSITPLVEKPLDTNSIKNIMQDQDESAPSLETSKTSERVTQEKEYYVAPQVHPRQRSWDWDTETAATQSTQPSSASLPKSSKQESTAEKAGLSKRERLMMRMAGGDLSAESLPPPVEISKEAAKKIKADRWATSVQKPQATAPSPPPKKAVAHGPTPARPARQPKKAKSDASRPPKTEQNEQKEQQPATDTAEPTMRDRFFKLIGGDRWL